MLAIKHILFPMDFSDRCCAAVPFVSKMANRFGAKITLISVVQPFWYSSAGDMGGAIAIDMEEIPRDVKTRLDTAAAKEFASLPTDTFAEIGEPAQVILEYAHTNGVDLIMMPTHG